ncbi:MAG: hypothetical protein ACKVWV_02220 [Planctomycetota bacterium]
MEGHRPMFIRVAALASSVIAASFACTSAQDESPRANPIPARAATGIADPLASFARFVGGEWKMTAQAGTSMYDVWHWGPGKHSLRVMTHGYAASGEPWHAVGVVYSHPGLGGVRSLALSPYERSVSEGSVRFDAQSAETVADLFQIGVRRKLVTRWDFEGPDQYHSTLLEEIAPGRLETLVEFDHFRSETLTRVSTPPADAPPKPSEYLTAFEPLLRDTWESDGHWVTGDAVRTRSNFEYVPYSDAIYARVIAPTTDGEPAHLLDAYVFHHTGANALRCLALSNRGGVYEGDVTVVEGGALQLDLKGYAGDQVVPYSVRFDFAPDATVRSRVWSLAGSERTLVLDVQHAKFAPKD